MVLSLVDISLISITNGIKDGTITSLHMVPPKLRHRVLETAIKRKLINHPNCLALLSSAEFFKGMTSISDSVGSIYDLKYLQRLIQSMATKLPNGETVGTAVTELDVTIYGSSRILDRTLFAGHSFWLEEDEPYPTVSQLIAECPNVTSLASHGGAIEWTDSSSTNESKRCLRAYSGELVATR